MAGVSQNPGARPGDPRSDVHRASRFLAGQMNPARDEPNTHSDPCLNQIILYESEVSRTAPRWPATRFSHEIIDQTIRGVNGASNDRPVAPLNVVTFPTMAPGMPSCVMVSEPAPFAIPILLTST